MVNTLYWTCERAGVQANARASTRASMWARVWARGWARSECTGDHISVRVRALLRSLLCEWMFNLRSWTVRSLHESMRAWECCWTHCVSKTQRQWQIHANPLAAWLAYNLPLRSSKCCSEWHLLCSLLMFARFLFFCFGGGATSQGMGMNRDAMNDKDTD